MKVSLRANVKMRPPAPTTPLVAIKRYRLREHTRTYEQNAIERRFSTVVVRAERQGVREYLGGKATAVELIHA